MNIAFRRVGSSITGFVQGKMLNKDFKDAEKAKYVEMLLRDYKKDGGVDEELWNEIEFHFFPVKRIARGNKLEVDGSGNVYLKGSKIPMPPELAETILKAADEGDAALDAYVNFWKLCLLNPNTTARDSFFRYVQNHGVVITDKGYVLMYKAVTHREKHDASVDLAQFVAKEFVSVAMKGGDPKDFVVYQTPTGYLLDQGGYDELDDHEVIGRLSGLMRDLQMRVGRFSTISKTETIYTDKHSRSMDIRLGVQQVKDRSECDPDINQECSYGLHLGAESYVKSFGNANDTIFLCLLNPKDVVAVPQYDSSKLRTCAYLPIGIMEQDEHGQWQAIQTTHFELDYIDYEVDELERQRREIEDQLVGVTPGDKSTFDLLGEQLRVIEQRVVDLRKEKTVSTDLKREQAPHDRPGDSYAQDYEEYDLDDYDEEDDDDYDEEDDTLDW